MKAPKTTPTVRLLPSYWEPTVSRTFADCRRASQPTQPITSRIIHSSPHTPTSPKLFPLARRQHPHDSPRTPARWRPDSPSKRFHPSSRSPLAQLAPTTRAEAPIPPPCAILPANRPIRTAGSTSTSSSTPRRCRTRFRPSRRLARRPPRCSRPRSSSALGAATTTMTTCSARPSRVAGGRLSV